MRFQPFVQLGQPFKLALLDAAGGDTRPLLHHVGQVFHGQFGLGQPLEALDGFLGLDDLAAQHGHLGVLLVILGAQLLDLLGQVVQTLVGVVDLLLVLLQADVPLDLLIILIGDAQAFLVQLGDLLADASLLLLFLVDFQATACLCLGTLLLDHILFQLQVGLLLLLQSQLHQVLVVQVHVRAGFIQQVDGLVGQEPVGDIALGHEHGLPCHGVGDDHLVEVLVVVGDAPDDLHGVVDGGLCHGDGLETAFQGGVLFDILPVFIEGRGAHHLNFTAGEGGFQDVGGVHGTFRVACTHHVVHLVDDQDDVPGAGDLLDEALHPALELAAELGACHQGGQVQQVDLLVLELVGHLPLDDALSQGFGDGGLAHARLADEAGVVLLSPVQNLNHTSQLFLSADDLIQLTGTGLVGQGDAVAVQVFGLLASLGLPFGTAHRRFLGLALLLFRVGTAVEQLAQEGEGGSLALFVLLVLAVLVTQVHAAAHQLFQPFRAAEGAHHLIGQVFHILLGDAHPIHHLLHRLDAQLLGAFQAQAFVHGVTFIQSGNENNRHIFMASRTQFRLHNVYSLQMCLDDVHPIVNF